MKQRQNIIAVFVPDSAVSAYVTNISNYWSVSRTAEWVRDWAASNGTSAHKRSFQCHQTVLKSKAKKTSNNDKKKNVKSRLLSQYNTVTTNIMQERKMRK